MNFFGTLKQKSIKEQYELKGVSTTQIQAIKPLELSLPPLINHSSPCCKEKNLTSPPCPSTGIEMVSADMKQLDVARVLHHVFH